MLTTRLLQVYVFLSTMEYLFLRLFGSDTLWKPYRAAALLVALVAIMELPFKRARMDRYDAYLLGIFVAGFGLSSVWLICGRTDWLLVLRGCIFVVIPLAMYFCIKLGTGTAQELEKLIRAFVLGALVNAGYAAYQVLALGQTDRPEGLSAAAPELALHSGVAFAFILYPYRSRCRATWLAAAGRAGAGALLVFAVLVSGTRAAWVALAVSTAAVLYVMSSSSFQRRILLKVLAPVLVLVAAGAALKVGVLLKRGNADLSSALEERVEWNEGLRTGSGRSEIWGQALDVAGDYYYLGGGFSGFMQATTKHSGSFQWQDPEDMEHGVATHNVLLEALTDYGPSSLLLLCLCLAALSGALFRRALGAKNPLWTHGMLFAFLFLTVCGLFRDLLGIQDFWIVLAFVTLSLRIKPGEKPARCFLPGPQVAPL